jgi:hypothetical protein
MFEADAVRAAVTFTDVQLAGPGPFYTVGISVPGFNGGSVEWAYLDSIVLTIDGRQELVMCDDLTHDISLGQSGVFDLGVVSSNFDGGTYSPTQISEMSWLLYQSESVWKTGGPGEAPDLAALQLASWEIGTPAATFTGLDPGVQALTAAYMSDAIEHPGASVVQYSSPLGIQGQIGVVPEPATWTLVMLGVGLIGAGLRMAQRQGRATLTAARQS